MKNHTIFGLLFLGFILLLFSCNTTKPQQDRSRGNIKAEVCFWNYATKVAEIQFSGEKYIHKVHPQQELCIKRLPGTYTYNLTIGRKTSKNLMVEFDEDSTGEVALTSGR